MNILIVGVGGQGTLLTSKVLGRYASLIGSDVKVSEVHGMSQRGGSVVTHVRIADTVYSPIIWEGGADVILSFEKLESLRYTHYLKDGGVMLVNDMKISPMPVITGAVEYPNDIEEQIKAKGVSALFIDALTIAQRVGNVKCVNIVMLGVLTKAIGFDENIMKQAIMDCVPQRFLQLNLDALTEGINSYSY